MPSGGRRSALLGPEGPRDGLDHDVLATDVDTMRVDDRDAVLRTFADFRPELVLHGGAFTTVDRCETEADAAFAVNAIGTRHVAEAAVMAGAHVVYVSTDYVFDGTAGRPYREWDTPHPASVYGRLVEAGGGAGVPARVDHRAHQLVVRGSRRQHGRHRAAPGRRRGRAPLRRRPTPAGPPSPSIWRRRSSPSGWTAGPASFTSPTAGTPRGGASCGPCWPRPARIRSACAHRRTRTPSASARRGPRTRCSTTWRCA